MLLLLQSQSQSQTQLQLQLSVPLRPLVIHPQRRAARLDMPMEHKPSSNEEEFFAKHDAELMKDHRRRLDAEREKAERHSHFMRCPKCGGQLTTHLHHHVKIERCNDCHGVWLDAGELEQLDRVQGGKVESYVKSLFGLNR